MSCARGPEYRSRRRREADSGNADVLVINWAISRGTTSSTIAKRRLLQARAHLVTVVRRPRRSYPELDNRQLLIDGRQADVTHYGNLFINQSLD